MSSSANDLEAATMKTAYCLGSTVVGPDFRGVSAQVSRRQTPHGHSRLFEADVPKEAGRRLRLHVAPRPSRRHRQVELVRISESGAGDMKRRFDAALPLSSEGGFGNDLGFGRPCPQLVEADNATT
jgi:hypothetical protein